MSTIAICGTQPPGVLEASASLTLPDDLRVVIGAGAFLLVALLMIGAATLWLILESRGKRPGAELASTVAVPGEPFTLRFTSGGVDPLGIWLDVDVVHELPPRYQGTCSTGSTSPSRSPSADARCYVTTFGSCGATHTTRPASATPARPAAESGPGLS